MIAGAAEEPQVTDCNLRLTGALLVGGASERFGSPKALATFQGETLAERGRRLLAEACDEVLVVGKEADRLPFPVLDDGAASHAPIHGVIAALRAARLEAAGVEFRGEILDSGVCHQSFFTDPDGNPLNLHHRYAPKA